MRKNYMFLKEFLWVLLASCLFSAGYNIFIYPSGVILGGATGLATVLHRLLPVLPVGVWILLLNLPLWLLCLKVLGRRFILRTVIGTLTASLLLDVFSFLPLRVDDPMQGALLGGGTIGLALGIMYAHGYNTGGADLAVFLLKKKYENLSPGLIVLILDAAIVLSSALVLGDLPVLGCSAIAIFTETTVLNSVLSGFDRGQLVFIFSNKHEQIAADVSKILHRGMTEVDATGWFTGRRGKALLCAVRKREVYRLKRIINDCDPNAFSVFTDAFSISGNGFERRI